MTPSAAPTNRLRPVVTRLTPAVYEQLSAVARREGITLADVVRRTLLERFGGPEHQPADGSET